MTFKTIESKRKGKKKVNHIYLRPTDVSFSSLKFEWLPYNWVVNSELLNRKFEKWYVLRESPLPPFYYHRQKKRDTPGMIWFINHTLTELSNWESL